MAGLPSRKTKSLPFASRTYQKWTEAEEIRVIELRRQGYSLVMIAGELDRTVAAVSALLRRHSIRWMNEEDNDGA